jgi:hypothetical protein
MRFTLRIALSAALAIGFGAGAMSVDGPVGRIFALATAFAVGVCWSEIYLANLVEKREAQLVQRIAVLRRTLAQQRTELTGTRLRAIRAEDELLRLRSASNGGGSRAS